MSSCCPICFRESEVSPTIPKQNEENFQEKFFRLFLRYLDRAEESAMQTNGATNFNGSGMVSCGQCMPLMKSLCELYHQLKATELLINWKVKTLKNVMSCAQGVPSRITNFRNYLKSVEAPGKFEDMLKSRKWFIESCSQKLTKTTAFPKLSIEKLRLNEEATLTGQIQSEQTEESTEAEEVIVECTSNGNQLGLAHSQIFGYERSDESPVDISEVFLASRKPKLEQSAAKCDSLPSSTSDEQEENLEFDCGSSLSDSDISVEMETTEKCSEKLQPNADLNAGNQFLFKCPDCCSLSADPSAKKVPCSVCHCSGEISNLKSLANLTSASTPPNNLFDGLPVPSSSSSSENPDNNVKSSRNHSDTVMETNMKPSQTLIPAFDIDPGIPFSFKCPNCSKLVADVNAKKLFCSFCRGSAELCCLKGPANFILSTSNELFMETTVFANRSDVDSALLSSGDSHARVLGSNVLPIPNVEIESLGGSKTILESNVVLPHTFRDVIRIQLKNPPEPLTDIVMSNCDPKVEVMSPPRLLRSTHRCQHCPRTFSSDERLQLHKEEDHLADMFLSDNDEVDEGNNDNQSDSEGRCYLPSSSMEQDDNLDTDGEESDTIMDANEECPDSYHSNIHANLNPKPSFKNMCTDPLPSTSSIPAEETIHKEKKAGSNSLISKYLAALETVPCPIEIETPKLEPHMVPLPTTKKKPKQRICKVGNCTATCSSKESFKSHKKLHGKFPCLSCDSTFEYGPDLSWHEVVDHENLKVTVYKNQRVVKVISCPRQDCSYRVGGVGFISKSRYIRHHLLKHLQLDPNALPDIHVCTICNAIMAPDPRTLRKHFRLLHNLQNLQPGKDALKCKEKDCKAYFLTPAQLLSHKREVHEIWQRFQCPNCDAAFSKSDALLSHRRKHHSESLLIRCTVEGCHARFDRKTGLDAHVLRKHGEIKQVKCPQCDRECWGEQGLIFHMKMHEPGAKKLNLCEHCGKEFTTKDHLQKHYLSHSGPDSWQFMCSVCSKKYISNEKLNEHMRIHTQDKPFVCSKCGQKYAHRHNLRIHVNSKHGDEVTDTPRKFDKTNLTTRKGTKRKRVTRDLDATS